MDTEKFKIWFAGFYEGEGSISNDISNNNKLRMCISQNDKTPLEKAQQIWGGSIRKRVRKSPASDKICTGYELRFCHNESLKVLDDIEQYMIIPYKIEQVKTAKDKAKEGLNRKFKCKFCENEYASPAGRRRHEKSAH
jgi:LAGLIDADG endonuclease